MLWYVGGALLAVWLVLTQIFHKAGFVHLLLLGAISLFVVQFAADQRLRQYKRSRKA
jgi:hypothetical protein